MPHILLEEMGFSQSFYIHPWEVKKAQPRSAAFLSKPPLTLHLVYMG
jgi:hypothetical protein